MSLHDSLGPRWSNISKMLTGRTAQQCRARWFQLSAADDDALSEGTTVSAAAARFGRRRRQVVGGLVGRQETAENGPQDVQPRQNPHAAALAVHTRGHRRG